MERIENEIRKRYFRKTPAYPNGAVTHRAACGMFSKKDLCSCGLLDALKPIWEVSPAKARELYPLVDIELPEKRGRKRPRSS